MIKKIKTVLNKFGQLNALIQGRHEKCKLSLGDVILYSHISGMIFGAGFTYIVAILLYWTVELWRGK